MLTDEVRAVFSRHMDEFRKEVAAFWTPENDGELHAAINVVLGEPGKATGLGGALARHWEPFIAKLLSAVESHAKKDELIEAFQRMLLEQVKEFSRILANSNS